MPFGEMRNANMENLNSTLNSCVESKHTKTHDRSFKRKNGSQKCKNNNHQKVPEVATLIDDFDNKSNSYFLFYVRTGVIKRVGKKVFSKVIGKCLNTQMIS